MTKLRLHKTIVCCFCLLFYFQNGKSFAIGETTLVSSRNSDGLALGDYLFALNPSISANGRFVAFRTRNILDDIDKNGITDVYVYDKLTKKNTLVSISSTGVLANNDSDSPSISADGRYVAFRSFASNLVSGDTNNETDIFVHDRATRLTTRVNVHSDGSQAASVDEFLFFYTVSKPSLSADGRFVAFTSSSHNLVDNDLNDNDDTFVHDRVTKQTSRVSINSSGGEGISSIGSVGGITVGFGSPSISANGRFIAFTSHFTNLVPSDTNNTFDVFVHDRTTKKTSRVSVAFDTSQGNLDSFQPKISANGRFVTFSSYASNLVAGDTNNSPDVFVHDYFIQETTRVSVGTNGKQALLGGSYSDISADGRYVAFISQSTDLVPLLINNEATFIHDRWRKETSIVSVDTDGGLGWISCCSIFTQSFSEPSLSADGRYVAFESLLPLTTNDGDNGFDVFVRDRSLNKNQQADLAVTNTQKPTSLIKDGVGSYQFTFTNNGTANIGILRIQHVLTNGEVISLTPSKGACHRLTTISLCNIVDLPMGASLTLTADIKALRNPLIQQLSVSSNGAADPKPGNNYLNVNTQVTP